jgi:hypothetical protein
MLRVLPLKLVLPLLSLLPPSPAGQLHPLPPPPLLRCVVPV